MAIRSRSHSSTTKRQEGRGGRRSRPPIRNREDLIKFHGIQECRALFEHRRDDVRRVFLLPDLEEQFEAQLNWCAKRGLPVRFIEFSELSTVAGTEHHEGVCVEAKPLKIVPPKDLIKRLSDMQRACLLVLENVENPHNLGAIVRTACFFGITAILVRSSQMKSLSGAACRVSEGAAEIVPISIVNDFGNIFEALKGRGFSVVATTPHQARSVYNVRWPDKVVVVFGAEGPGLSEQTLAVADIRVAVPRLGPMESLNVGTAVAAILTEARRELVLSGAIRKFH
jgi:RNA methyltransferase, TrmH family